MRDDGKRGETWAGAPSSAGRPRRPPRRHSRSQKHLAAGTKTCRAASPTKAGAVAGPWALSSGDVTSCRLRLWSGLTSRWPWGPVALPFHRLHRSHRGEKQTSPPYRNAGKSRSPPPPSAPTALN